MDCIYFTDGILQEVWNYRKMNIPGENENIENDIRRS